MERLPRCTIFPALAILLAAMPLRAEVHFVSWGGAYELSQQKAFVDTWQGGRVVIHEYGGGLDEIREQVDSGSVRWDIVDVLPQDARQGCTEGLFEELDPGLFAAAADGTAMEDDVMVIVPNACVAPLVFWSYVTFFADHRFGDRQPRKVADFFDVRRFPGKRGIHRRPDGLIEMALVADGVEIKDVYKVLGTDDGIDRAFRVLDRIRRHRVFWDAGDEPIDLVKSGRASIALAYSGRVGAAVLLRDEKFTTIWDAQVLHEEWLVMVKGAPNRRQALDFLVHSSSPKQLAEQARYITYGPMRASSFGIIRANEPWFHNGQEVLPHLPNRPQVMPRTVVANTDWWVKNGPAIAERYSAWADDR